MLNSPIQLSESASAMQYLHENGIVHGNLTPSSIFVSPTGHAWLNGFELSKSAKFPDTRGLQEYFMTAQYMGPELYSGEPIKTMESDVYAFGMVAEQASASSMLERNTNDQGPRRFSQEPQLLSLITTSLNSSWTAYLQDDVQIVPMIYLRLPQRCGIWPRDVALGTSRSVPRWQNARRV